MNPVSTAASPTRVGRGRTRLNRDLILDRALEIARTPGVDAIRIRDLGATLGVDPSAVYRHFQSKNDLMTALVDRLGHMMMDEIDTSPARSWRDVLTDVSEVSLRLYLEYPAIGAVAASVYTESTDIVEDLLAAFHRGGLRGDRLVGHYTLFASYLLSFSGSIARSRIDYGEAYADRAWAEDVRSATASSHPTASLYREQILVLTDVDVYRAGIQLLLDAAEAAAEQATV